LYSDGTGLIASNRSAGRSIPPYLVRGVVLDERKQPIFGAALIVDRDQVFTDSDGVFISRKKKGGEYDLKVDLANFLIPENFVVISAPARVQTTVSGAEEGTIVVRLRRSGTLSQARQR
jgi:hypothetical protein